MIKNKIWRVIPDTNGFYQISEEGELRRIKGECKVFAITSLVKSIYEEVAYEKEEVDLLDYTLTIPTIKIPIKHKHKNWAISSLMYEAFHGIRNVFHSKILHVDGNEYNNNLKNLILCESDEKVKYYAALGTGNTYKFNSLKGQDGQEIYLKRRTQTCVSEYDIEGYLLMQYPNVQYVSDCVNLPSIELYKCIHGIKKLEINNRLYKLGLGPKRIDTNLIRENKIILHNVPGVLNNKMIFQYSKSGELLKIYNNINEASQHNTIPIRMFLDALKAPKEFFGFIWMFRK